MIRFFWALLNAVLSTFFFGSITIFASLLRLRGPVYSWATREWGRAILWASGSRVVTHGDAAVDWTEPQVLVANHIAAFDILAVASVMPARFAFIAKHELGGIPFFGKAMEAAGHIFVDRSDRQKSIQSLRLAGEKMRREHSTVIIFAEGTRSRTGELLPFKKGAFMLAQEGGVRILPLAIVGSDGILDARRLRVRPRTIHLFFGQPVHPGTPEWTSTDALMTEVRGRMRALLAAAGPG